MQADAVGIGLFIQVQKRIRPADIAAPFQFGVFAAVVIENLTAVCRPQQHADGLRVFGQRFPRLEQFSADHLDIVLVGRVEGF